MTRKEFKYDMQRGLGSCIVELMHTQDKNKYKDILIWGCKHELAYDAQCEGTRSLYLYQMIKMYENLDAFFEAVCSRIDKCLGDSGWEFMQHAELCALMAGDGYASAAKKLNEVYAHLLDILMHRKRRSKCGAFPERENLGFLCIAKVTYQYDDLEAAKQEYIRIVNDLGRLFLYHETLYSFGDFLWFQDECEESFGKKTTLSLLKAYAKEEGVAMYRKAMDEYELFSKGQKEQPDTAEEIYRWLCEGKKVGADISRFVGVRFQRQNKQEEIERLAEAYAKEQDISVRIELLKLLKNRHCAEVLDIDSLIHDSKSEQEELRQSAFTALCYIKSEKVHDYAYELIAGEQETCYAVRMLLRNYDSREKEFVIQTVKAIPISRNRGDWHSVFQDAMDLLKDSAVKNPPKELLMYMYRNTWCSFCRESVVREMGRRRMLTAEVLEECLWDCNEEIREYVEGKVRCYEK